MSNQVSRVAFAACLIVIAASSPGCSREHGPSSHSGPPPAGTAIVWGSVIDLRSGEPAADVEVSFESGRAVRTDAHGLFEIGGLSLGAAGSLRARAADGREGTLQLLPLKHERREVVLHIRAN